ncbi:MAG TPA: dioxygenase [Polyangiaceae bacterium]|nr:dioxygenase [Polyangiaceae bacterium]
MSTEQTETVRPTATMTGRAATRAFREGGAHEGTGRASAARVSALARDVLARIHEVIREHDVTYPEYQAVKQWLIEVGEAGEWPLFLDVFAESVVEQVHNARREGTKGSILGPYYLPGQRALPARCTLPMRADEPGLPLIVEGQVRGLDGEPIAGAVLDLWQADAHGYYSGFAPEIPDGNLRGVITTGADGRFEIRTIQPAPYEIPKDGPTGKLLSAAEWHAWRPAHLHLIVRGRGYRNIITQLYFEGGSWLDDDVASATKPELVLAPKPDAWGVQRVTYDFVLDPA